jgi:hypothetical protein
LSLVEFEAAMLARQKAASPLYATAIKGASAVEDKHF